MCNFKSNFKNETQSSCNHWFSCRHFRAYLPGYSFEEKENGKTNEGGTNSHLSPHSQGS